MKKYPRPLIICTVCLLVLLLAGVYLWKTERDSANSLANAERQLETLRPKVLRYVAQRQLRDAPESDAENLFAGINKIAMQTGVHDRLENLRPAEDKQGETLELQLRALYLGETMRFISHVESLKNTGIERMTLRRNPNSLLDLELRVRRQESSQ